MVDLRADTASSSDKTEFTETEDQSRTHHCLSMYKRFCFMTSDHAMFALGADCQMEMPPES